MRTTGRWLLVWALTGLGCSSGYTVIDGDIDGEAIDGSIGVSVYGWFDLPTAYTGSFTAVDEMEGGFGDSFLGVTFEGAIDAHRVAMTP